MKVRLKYVCGALFECPSHYFVIRLCCGRPSRAGFGETQVSWPHKRKRSVGAHHRGSDSIHPKNKIRCSLGDPKAQRFGELQG